MCTRWTRRRRPTAAPRTNWSRGPATPSCSQPASHQTNEHHAPRNSTRTLPRPPCEGCTDNQRRRGGGRSRHREALPPSSPRPSCHRPSSRPGMVTTSPVRPTSRARNGARPLRHTRCQGLVEGVEEVNDLDAFDHHNLASMGRSPLRAEPVVMLTLLVQHRHLPRGAASLNYQTVPAAPAATPRATPDSSPTVVPPGATRR